MKIAFTFEEADRERILKVVELARAIFPGARVRPPETGKDGQFHVYIVSPKH